jgi:NitT/TauT family transport system substrate-binding protein
MSQRVLASFLVSIVASAAVFFGIGYYIGFKTGYDAAFMTPIRLGYLLADVHQISFFVAYYEGFYEEEGIRPVKWEYVNGPTEMMALAAGDLDAGYVGVVPALIAKSQGVDLVIVASANLEGSAIVAKPDIKTIQDLDGKTVGTPGIGTIQASLLYMVEQKLNITVNTEHHEGPVNLPLEFERGRIDAYIAWEPFVAEAVVRKLGNVIYTSHDILPNHQCCVFYVSGKLYREQPELVKTLLKIHLKAMKFVTQQPENAMKIFAERTGKNLTVIQESWNRMKWNPHLNTTSMEVFVEYLIQQGKINADDVPNIEDFIEAAVDQKLLAEVEAFVP